MDSGSSSPLVIILTHEHTDFDALASMLAAAKLYPNALPILPRQMNRNLEEFLAVYRDVLPFMHLEDLPRRRVDQAVLVDTQSFQPLRGMHAGTAIDVFDHHPPSPELPSQWRFYGEEVGATSTLLVEKIMERAIGLTPTEATLLMLGIYEDTGGLAYESTTARDLRVAAELLERGASLLVVDRFLHHPLTEEQRELYQQLADNSHAYQFHGQSVIVATACVEEPVAEISTLAHKLRDLYEPQGLFMLVDMGHHIQVVARSTSDAIDVGEIARALGGGGHSRAAAALVRDGSLGGVYDTLVYLLEAHVRPQVTVAQLMSYGMPQTLAPTDTIREAAQRMQRFGFEGFPVLQDGRIVGMLTRREIDRAVHHGLFDHEVSRYMRAGEVYVTPEDSIEKLRSVMSDHDWGQVPVVDGKTGRLLGIVTRTDLIKQWTAPAPAEPGTLEQQMTEALPVPLAEWLRLAGSAAREMGYQLYAVGGFVRDLLLHMPNFDIDLVVEGDAIRLAQQLAERVGGRVRSHRRFGTAKWLVPEELRSSGNGWLPDSLDFVTARTEFYERPTALPTVERGNIKLDLHRRDFTINTLAVRLEQDHWGELLDFYGGKKDLDEGLIRVLHNLSFVEDPTRILRAVRFEQRFGFRIETRTEKLIEEARDLLARVSGERVRHELELILEEAEPERIMCRLAQLDVLGRIHPELPCDAWLQQRARQMRVSYIAASTPDSTSPPFMELPRGALCHLQLGLMTWRMTRAGLDEFIERYRILKGYRDVLEQAASLRTRLEEMEGNQLRPSRIVTLLAPFDEEARLLARVATDSWLVRQRLDDYQRRLRHVQAQLTGDDLRRMGLQPGPVFRQILDRLRAARLDGEARSRPDEETLVRAIMAERAEANAG